MLKLNFAGKLDELKDCLDILSGEMDFELSESGTKINVYKADKNGLIVEGKDGEYSITYGIIPDFCRALCMMLDYLKKGEKDFLAQEERKIERCGIMADVSRNAVLKVKTAKDIISRIARMGMNTFMLYMEDIYKVEKYPYFGYMRGAYEKEELQEIDRFAKIFGVEVVPCMQTLGHLKKALWWPYANNIRDTEDILLIDEPETYEFIEAMIESISQCFSTKRIHIGMDEAFGLGMGEYFKRHGLVDKFEMLSRHLTKVNEIVKKYGLEPMMWADMFFRLGSATSNYFDKNLDMPADLKEKIPKGVTMVYYDYYNEDEEMYSTMIRKHQILGNDVAFFGGIWTWNGVAINYDKTFRATRPAMRACHKSGMQEICATLWGDDGGETSIYAALLGMQMYSEYAYHEEVSDEQLRKMFRICTGYDMDTFLLLDVDNFPESERYKETAPASKATITVSKQVLYQDVLHGLLDKHFENIDLRGHYTGILNKLEKAEIPQDLKLLFDYHTQLVRVLSMKCDMGLRAAKDYLSNDKEALKADSEELKQLKKEMEIMHDRLSALWLNNNNAIGLDRLDHRIGGVIMRVKRAYERIDSYLNGEVKRLEELEEPRYKYTNDEFLFCQYSVKYLTFSV